MEVGRFRQVVRVGPPRGLVLSLGEMEGPSCPPSLPPLLCEGSVCRPGGGSGQIPAGPLSSDPQTPELWETSVTQATKSVECCYKVPSGLRQACGKMVTDQLPRGGPRAGGAGRPQQSQR